MSDNKVFQSVGADMEKRSCTVCLQIKKIFRQCVYLTRWNIRCEKIANIRWSKIVKSLEPLNTMR